MPTPEAVALVQRWLEELFTRGDLDAADELVAPDVVVHSQGHTKGYRGAAAFKNWLRWYCNTFVDREWTVHDIISEGEKVVARYSGYTTYQGGLLDIPARDQRVRETGILIFRVVDGKVQEFWCEMSDLQVMEQLGAFPG